MKFKIALISALGYNELHEAHVIVEADNAEAAKNKLGAEIMDGRKLDWHKAVNPIQGPDDTRYVFLNRIARA